MCCMGLPFLQLSSHFFNSTSLVNTLFYVFTFLGVSLLAFSGLGPRLRISLSNSVASRWNFCPSAAVQYPNFKRSASSPMDLSTSLRYSTWRYAK